MLVGIATAVVNVLIPVFVRSRFAPRRAGVMTGVYALSMGAGSALVAASMVLVWESSGHSWRTAVALAIVPAALAAAGIAPQLRYAGGEVGPEPVRFRVLGGRDKGLAWSLIGYFGLQTLLFYTTFAWLPVILVEAGVSEATAGAMQSLSILGVAAGGFLAPVLAAARTDQRPHLLAVLLLCGLGYAGLLAAPATLPAVRVLVLGAGLGGGQAVVGVLYVKRGRDQDHVAALSTVAQTGGYLIAATGPVAASVLRTVTGTWAAPLLVFLGVLLLSGAASLRAGRG
ncbi:MFS transporter [Streptomyces sp. NBC_01116]|uniref:MFS transporter n=1 Tax=Streptomyces sp. NBC_01116 TaxID=2903752 RepID=UPI003250CF65